MIIRQR